MQACEDDESGDDTPPEFVATNSDFANFRNWTEVATNTGPDPVIGMAHQAEDHVFSK